VNSIVRSCDASAERAEHDLLGRVFCLTGPLHQRCSFFAADPVWHRHLFELHFAADRFQFGRDVFNRLGGLGRPGQPRADVVREMRDLPIRVIAAQRGLLQAFQIGQRLLRKNNWSCGRGWCGYRSFGWTSALGMTQRNPCEQESSECTDGMDETKWTHPTACQKPSRDQASDCCPEVKAF